MWLPADILTLPDVVRYWAAATPERTALSDDHRRVSWALLDARSNALAHALLARGTRPGSHVGYLGRNAIEFWESWFGVTKAGSALAPFNWRCATPELVELVRDADVRLLVVEAGLAATADAIVAAVPGPVDVVVFDAGRPSTYEDLLGGGATAPPDVAVPGDRTALLAYTSGTTGTPKGVQLPHRALQYWFQISAMERSETWSADDLFLTVMPNFHLAGTVVPLPCLYHGGTVTVVPAFEPAAVLAAIRDRRPTVTCLVPTAIALLLADPATTDADLSSLRAIYYAGSGIAVEVLERALARFGCALSQFYGTSETYIITLLRPDQHDPGRPDVLGSCGTPMPFVEVRLVGPAGEEVGEVPGDDRPGEVLVRSPMVFSGYWNKPEATRDAFVDGWYRTGDVGRRDAEGNLHLIDRVKDVIVTGGENVYSVEVERALSRHPAVVSVAVVGAPDARWGERIVAFVVPTGPEAATPEELREHCRGLIAGYKVPKWIHLVPDLPLTASGKVQKNVLRARAS